MLAWFRAKFKLRGNGHPWNLFYAQMRQKSYQERIADLVSKSALEDGDLEKAEVLNGFKLKILYETLWISNIVLYRVECKGAKHYALCKAEAMNVGPTLQ